MFARWEADGLGQWAAEDRETGALVGLIGLMRHHDWPRAPARPVEVGWALDRAAWGRGLATEGGQAAVDAWREHLPGDARLLSIALPENARSIPVMLRLGFRRGGSAPWRGLHVDWFYLDR